MPYIKKDQRPELDEIVDFIVYRKLALFGGPAETDGRVNYLITRILRAVYGPPSYFTYNRAIGVLECIKQEFYRRQVAPYEDTKMAENGDVA